MWNSSLLFPTSSQTSPAVNNNLTIPLFFFITPSSYHYQQQWQLKQPKKRRQSLALSASYEVGGGFLVEDLDIQGTSGRTQENRNQKLDTSQYQGLLKGGEQVTSVLQEMITIIVMVIGFPASPTSRAAEILNSEHDLQSSSVERFSFLSLLVQYFQGFIGKRVDQMELGFMMALVYMIQMAEKDQDDKRKLLLEVIKETVLSHLTKKCPLHVQVIGLLCRTPNRESRHELLRRVAAGGGVFKSENGTKVHIPGENLNDIVNQTDDLLETMESRPVVPDRKLLARLVLIREEARNMMGVAYWMREMTAVYVLYLKQRSVNFLTKLVALKPGKTVQEMIKNVMQGKDEGPENSDSDEEYRTGRRVSSGIAGRKSVTGRKPLPVRPGMFLETVTKVLGGIYAGNDSGITAQHLEWVHQKTLQVLEDIAF